MKKKVIVSFVLSAMLLTALPMTVSAHGHGHRGSVSTNTAYTLCGVEDCNTVGRHLHDGVTYAGHYVGDGHDYHQVCSVEDCTLTGSHEHDGTACLPHSGNDGHGYHSGRSGHRGGCHR